MAGIETKNYILSSDPRLTNSRPASDVYPWAKAANKPAYTAAEVGAAAIYNPCLTGGNIAQLSSTGSIVLNGQELKIYGLRQLTNLNNIANFAIRWDIIQGNYVMYLQKI